MVSGSVSILLTNKWKLTGRLDPNVETRLVTPTFSPALARTTACEPFLRIPPFPGARLKHFAKVKTAAATCDDLAAEFRRLRVGGSYWGAQPELPENYVLATSAHLLAAGAAIADGQPVLLWDRASTSSDFFANRVAGECDPWHMLSGASALVAPANDELHIIAALLGIPSFDASTQAAEAKPLKIDAAELITQELSGSAFENPFTGAAMSVLEAIELCGIWRKLIDSNRDIAGGLGFAFWKQDHVAPLLWGGSQPFKFMRKVTGVQPGTPIAVWRAKVPAETLSALERSNVPLIEVEDGFLRSHGLGADCVPPLSITVDPLGPYFDPSRASELEHLLQHGQFEESLIERAGKLRRLIVGAGLGKYSRGNSVLDRSAGQRRHVLVPGQVEDDRAVTAGGCGLVSNLALLRKVREQAPEAYIIYKPHPDVVAGHRRGAIAVSSCLEFADEIAVDVPISSLIAMVDEVHVNTSLAGFEALLREKVVITYGVPFYAGWGLTRDLGPVPARRTRSRSLDEVVAAAMLLYPRYLDPVTGLPCPAEVIVSRLTCAEDHNSGLIVAVRRVQGKFLRRVRSLAQ